VSRADKFGYAFLLLGAPLAYFVNAPAAVVSGLVGLGFLVAAHIDKDDESTSILGDLSLEPKLELRETKDRLGRFLVEGEKLLRLRDLLETADNELAVRKWATEVRDLIQCQLGEGEANLFLSDAGYVFYVDSSKPNRVKVWLEGRVRRLAELIKKL
jgi:hypothetical protein